MPQEPKDQIEGGWHEWHGGLMPVSSHTHVEVMMAGQDKPEQATQAGNWHWLWRYEGECGGDIVAWRLVATPQESEELAKAAKLVREQQIETSRLEFEVHRLTEYLAHQRSHQAHGCMASVKWHNEGEAEHTRRLMGITRELARQL